MEKEQIVALVENTARATATELRNNDAAARILAMVHKNLSVENAENPDGRIKLTENHLRTAKEELQKIKRRESEVLALIKDYEDKLRAWR